MSTANKIKQNQRLSRSQKNKNSKAWYKEQADMLDDQHHSLGRIYDGEIDEWHRMKVNYDLFNNIIDLSDFTYVCQPFGAESAELPAKMVNRDIVSGKINALLGMEMKRPFSWKVVATNSEATTRKETFEFEKIKEYVISEIMLPIRQQVEQEYQKELQGKDLNDDEIREIQERIQQETKALTPPEVKRYMEREYQDPVEVMSHQLLEYLIKKCDIKRKFNETFKHLLLSAKGIMYTGIFNGEPNVWNVNSLRFNCDKSPDNQFIEDGEWATCEYRMTPSEVIKYFGEELSQKEIDDVYDNYSKYRLSSVEQNLFSFNDDYTESDIGTIRVLHCTWKSLRKIGFLSYLDEEGELQEILVDEGYELNILNGDVSIDWEWIPEVYEAWKIGPDMYKRLRPVPGQFKDLDNLYKCKLPYYGAICDNINSAPTSLMDRLKVYQYYYNIIMYRIELLMASDKGKKLLMNIKSVPSTEGMDIKKWQYFFESTPFGWFDPTEEGNSYADVNTMAKVLDLSLGSDIQKYMQLAEYIKKQAGESVGITPQIEGQIGPDESVGNTRQNLIQSSHILEPYFDLHSHVKKNVLEALLELSKIAYSESDSKKLTYVLDDMSRKIIDLDIALLDNSTLGLFVSNSVKAEEAKETIRQFAHAALQNQKAELSDVISIIRQEGIVEAEETLKVAEQNRREYERELQESTQKANAEEAEKERQFEREKMKHEKELAVLKEEEKRKTEIIKNSILGASFNPDQDVDNDGINDFIELARHGLDAEIKRDKNKLDRDKLEHQKDVDKKKLKIEEQKLKQNKSKK